MTPEDADSIWWDEMRKMNWHHSSGQSKTQHELRMQCWMVLMAHVRKAYQEENERLRERVRELEGN